MRNKILSTGRTTLKPIEKEDYDYIYNWITDFDYNMLWSNIREFPRKESFFELFDFNIINEFSFYFMIQKKGNKNIGTIFIHDYNKTDNYASISAFILPEFQNKFYGIDSYVLAFDFIVQNLPLRKLYLDVFSYNVNSISLIEKIGFKREGVFKKHRYYKGEYHDLNRYSLFMSELSSIKEKFNLL